jgi:putative peptide zinc metalloprotease protein
VETVAAADGHAVGGGRQLDPTSPTQADAVSAWIPRRLDGVELVGEYDASGYRRTPAIVRRGDGQVLQLTPLLYAALDAIDGQRSLAEIAEHLSATIDRRVSVDNVRVLAEEKLAPLGVILRRDGSAPELKRSDPLLGLRLRATVLGERVANALAAPFGILFHPLIVVPAVVAFVAAAGWLLFVRGMAGGTRELLYSPSLLLAVFAVTILSAGLHEFGHAAGLRYSGGRSGGMGVGLYIVWPAFFTDVTDAYRLPRTGRLRTDLGGLYFNALIVLATVGVWRVTGAEAVLVLVPLQLLQMMHQLLPVVRLDGYHILADLCGVPDLFARIKPTLLRLVPGRQAGPEVTALKPWVQVVVTLWVLLVVPLLLVAVLFTAISFPRIVATAWDSSALQWKAVAERFDAGEWAGVLLGLIGTGAVLLPVLGGVFMVSRLLGKSGTAIWSRASGVRGGRPVALVAGVAVVAGLAALWWPNGEYRPLQPGERGTVADGIRTLAEVPTGRPALTEERADELGGAPARAEQEPAVTAESTTTTTPDESPPTTARATTRSTAEVRVTTTTSPTSDESGDPNPEATTP